MDPKSTLVQLVAPDGFTIAEPEHERQLLQKNAESTWWNQDCEQQTKFGPGRGTGG
jgi:hypothetical protein